tara:strand:+ start:709 stop:1461 length:753 start_codon:yes stop_codon:yes gene_type:complete
MISKNKLQSIISKYHLGGKVESVKWVVEGGTLTIDFMAPTKDMIGRVIAWDFPLSQDGTLAIFNTSQLNRLMGVLTGDLVLDAERTKAVLTKLNIQDAKSTINYSLADPLMIQKVGEVDEDVQWQVNATLENDDFHTLVRAASAIQGNELVTLNPTKDIIGNSVLQFTFGERMEFSNKVEFHVAANFEDNVREDNKIPFSSEMLREIFNAHKTSDECQLSFVDDGLLRLIFRSEDENIDSMYFVVRKADY